MARTLGTITGEGFACTIREDDDGGTEALANGGIIASTTWYRHRDRARTDPAAYVDAETVRYIVVPPLIVQHTHGVVADRGPANKIGELSIAAARAVGLPSSPRHGGTEKPEVLYELWPSVAAPGYELQPS